MFEFETAPGDALATHLDAALRSGLASLTDVELRDFLVATERLTSWCQAAAASAIGEIAERDLKHQEQLRESLRGRSEPPTNGMGLRQRMFADDPHRFLADEVATELSVSRGSAQYKVDFALSLKQYPGVEAGLRTGRLDRPKADAITDLLANVESDPFRETLELAAVDYGTTHTKPQLRAWLRKKIMAGEPRVAERRRQQAKEQRRLRLYPAGDGMATLAADLPAEDALAIYRTIDQIAHASCAKPIPHHNPTRPVPKLTRDGRTLEQRRADAFTDLLLARTGSHPDGAPDKAPDKAAGVAEVQVVVPVETLAGVGSEPGQLVGYGPITAAHARELADGDCRWRRLLTDPTGAVVEVTPHTYKPGRALDRLIKARDVTCRFPGCRRPANTTTPDTTTPGVSNPGVPNPVDLDHTIPWPTGLTVQDNLAALCRSHHLLKTHTDWQVTQDKAGVLTWVTPSGRTFRTHPHHYPAKPAGDASADDVAHEAAEPRSGAPPDDQAA